MCLDETGIQLEKEFETLNDIALNGIKELSEIGLAEALQNVFSTEGIDTRLGLQELGTQIAFQLGDFIQQLGVQLILAAGAKKLIDEGILSLATFLGGTGALIAGITAYAAGTAIKAGARNRSAAISNFSGRGGGSFGGGGIRTVGTPPTLSLNAPTSGTTVQPININIIGRLEADGSQLIAVINAAEQKNVRVTGRRQLV